MSRQPSRSRTFRLILTVTLVPLWVACDGRIVEPPGPTTITISPSSATLHSIDDTVQLSAVVHDQNGQVMPEAPVWWAGSEPSVAAINTTGMVTAARNGRANVTASVGAVSATAVITVAQVVAEVSVSPSADTLVALEDTVRRGGPGSVDQDFPNSGGLIGVWAYASPGRGMGQRATTSASKLGVNGV